MEGMKSDIIPVRGTNHKPQRVTYTCIPDRRLLPLAVTSLPRALQFVHNLKNVVTKCRMPAYSRFGPIRGVRTVVTPEEGSKLCREAALNKQFLFLLKDTEQGGIVQIDVSDESVSNWIRFVSPSEPGAANLHLQQIGQELYAVAPHTLARHARLTLPWVTGADGNIARILEGQLSESEDPFDGLENLETMLEVKNYLKTGKGFSSGRRAKLFRCSKCEAVFSRMFCLKRHILKCQHPEKLVNNSTSPNHASAACEPPIRPTQDTPLGVQNVKILSHIRRFSCACGKVFSRKDKLTCHIKKKHPVGKNKRIQPINKESGTEVQAAETGDDKRGQFACQLCESKYRWRGNLVNHLALKHPTLSTSGVTELAGALAVKRRNFYCAHCARSFLSAAQRKRHSLRMHPGKRVPPSMEYVVVSETVMMPAHHCPEPGCHKQYASNGKLLRHLRQKHANKLPMPLDVPIDPPSQLTVRPVLTSTPQALPPPDFTSPPSPPPLPCPVPSQSLPMLEEPFDGSAIVFLAAEEHAALMRRQGNDMQAVTLELQDTGMMVDGAFPGATMAYLATTNTMYQQLAYCGNTCLPSLDILYSDEERTDI